MARVLVADDDPMILRLLETALGAAGHDVLTANDGREALNQLQNELPDIVILDGMMPEVGGLEVLQFLKGRDDTRDLPIVLMTARAEEEDIAQGLEMGATEYLVKPFPPKIIVELVSRLTG